MVAGLKMYYRACLDRNRRVNTENSYPGILNEAHGSAQNDTVETSKKEIDVIKTTINDFKAEIEETLKMLITDMEKRQEKIITQLRDSGPDIKTNQDDPRNENGGHKRGQHNRRTPAKGDGIQEKIKRADIKKTDLDGGGYRKKAGMVTTIKRNIEN